jgi:hypothetical protein
MKKPKQPVDAVNSFYCPTCDQTLDGPTEFKTHLTQAHGITEFKGTRKTVLHLDCADCYIYEFELEIGGLKFSRSTRNPRKTHRP